MAAYLDCAATTPLDPRVRDEVIRYLDTDFGNAGSHTHDYGHRARSGVETARSAVAAVVGASRGEVIFTSGATESNNLAILGLASHGEAARKTHIVTTRIEHHAVLDPVAELEKRGFAVTRIAPDENGAVTAEAISEAVRADTLLISVMHVNNETGVIQPVDEIAEALEGHPVLFHVDAAQGFGKEIAQLHHPRIDLISISGHKICGPKGVGALIARQRAGRRPPLEPLLHGGGQERGLRPGTLAVPLIAGLGKAAELALSEHEQRTAQNRLFRERLLSGLAPLVPCVNGDPSRSLPNILNLSIPGRDAEEVMDAWKDLVAISHGAACTSQNYTCSHVLSAMGLDEPRKAGALRFSWCHLSELPDLPAMVRAIA
jgi:cysteine desulfurase